ncbi:MAG: choice-of-anchor J domain-containing protein [Ignavibacteriaceae bacterium]|nr:choice-of-anchor J domain-containing protein [Ignavibacteriaceae bacterium]
MSLNFLKKFVVLVLFLSLTPSLFAQFDATGELKVKPREVELISSRKADNPTPPSFPPLETEVEMNYDGANTDAIGAADATFIVAANFNDAIAGAFVGNQITKVRFYIGYAPVGNTVTVKLYGAGTTSPGAELHSQAAAVTANSWNEVTLTTPVVIPAGGVWVGYEGIAGGTGVQYFAGCDAGPNHPEGQWIYFQAAWQKLAVLNPALTYNWNIRAVVLTSGPGGPSNPNPANGARVFPVRHPYITWENPAGITHNKVYFGTDSAAVTSFSSSVLVFNGTPNNIATSYNNTPDLLPNTKYFWRVVEFNGADSSAGGVWNFSTANIYQTLTENFNTTTAGQRPIDWSGDLAVVATGGVANSPRLTRNIYGTSANATGTITTPAVALSANAKLTFEYRVVNWSGYPATATPAANFGLKIWISTDGANFTQIDSIGYGGNHVVSTDYATKTYLLNAYAGQTIQARITAVTLNSGDYYADFDDFYIGTPAATLNPPSGLTASTNMYSQIKLNWIAPPPSTNTLEKYLVYRSGNLVDSTTTLSYTDNGMPLATNVDYYVIAKYTEGLSVASNTATGLALDPGNFLIIEDFEGVTLPSGWAIVDVNNDAVTWAPYNAAAYNHTPGGTYSLAISYSTTQPKDDYAFTKALNLRADSSYNLRYWYRIASATFPEKMKVVVSTSQTAAGVILTIDDMPNMSNITYAEKSIDFNVPANGTYYIGFYAYSITDMFRIAIDDVSLERIPFIPVELVSLSAKATGNSVNLTWSTATETNNKGFEVERKSGANFETIAFVDGNGTTVESKSYSFVDKNLTSGVHTYRLKQIDFDGTFAYSKEIEVDVTIPAEFGLGQNYPNPFNPVTRIQYNLATDANVTFKIFNTLGEEVATLVNGEMPAGMHTFNFDASKLNSGVYFYSIEASGANGANFSSVKKMILMK